MIDRKRIETNLYFSDSSIGFSSIARNAEKPTCMAT